MFQEISSDLDSDSDDTQIDEPAEARRQSSRQRRVPVRYGTDEYVEAAIISQTIEPKNIVEALEKEDWKTAANAEYMSLIENDTWTL